MRVIGPRVVVRRIEGIQPKSSILEVITFDEEPSQFALVLAVGWREHRDFTRHPIEDIAVGDVVILKTYSGAPVRVNGEDAVIVTVDDVLAICEL